MSVLMMENKTVALCPFFLPPSAKTPLFIALAVHHTGAPVFKVNQNGLWFIPYIHPSNTTFNFP